MAEIRSAGGKRQRRSAEDWREIFVRRAVSGLPIGAFLPTGTAIENGSDLQNTRETCVLPPNFAAVSIYGTAPR